MFVAYKSIKNKWKVEKWENNDFEHRSVVVVVVFAVVVAVAAATAAAYNWIKVNVQLQRNRNNYNRTISHSKPQN